MYTYSYTKANVKYLDHLHKYILGITTLPSDFYINEGSELNIVFTNELTSEQIIILNNAIIDYNLPQELLVPFYSDTIMLQKQTVSTDSYSVIGSYFYEQAVRENEGSQISSFTFVSNINGNSSYKIRVYDTLNNTVLCETNSLNNTVFQIIKLTNIINIPVNNTLLEIQCQVSTSSNENRCNIKLVNIDFSKLMS